MNPTEKWNRIRSVARQASDERGNQAPFGFAPRVAALWAAGARPILPDLWEWLSIRSVLVAVSVMLLTLALNADLFTGGAALEVSVVDTLTGPVL